jgi:glycosyltransferase involved in cell wall biosynthesis
MRLSIVMCTYNGARFLHEQLESITMQSRKPDEMWICDDGSVDNTLGILRHFAGSVNYPVNIQCNASRLGAVKNFDQTISFSQGEVIVLSDQDDIWQRNKLQVIEEALAANPDAGYAFSDAVMINEIGDVVHPSLWEQVSFDQRRREIFSLGALNQVQVLLKGNVVTGATMAFRGSLKANVLPVPELWIHDEWIAFASSFNGERGIPIDSPLVYYRLHPAQAIGVRPKSSYLPFLLYRAWQSFIGNPEAYEDNSLALRKLEELRALLQNTTHRASTLASFLETKMAHHALRVELYRRSRSARLPAIIAELMHGGYHHHAAGWKSVIKDLLVPTISAS